MIIALCGFAGSGKGTVADILTQQNFKKISFADTLKDITATLFDWPRGMVEGDTQSSREFREKKDEFWSKKFGIDFTPRLALQLMGTEACRNTFHQDIWVYTTEKQLKKYPLVVIPDVRYPNEVNCIRQYGGNIVRIKRGPDPAWYRTAWDDNLHNWFPGHKFKKNGMKILYPEVHSSEWAWIGTKFDYTIDNNGTLDDLEQKVKNMLHIFQNSDTIL